MSYPPKCSFLNQLLVLATIEWPYVSVVIVMYIIGLAKKLVGVRKENSSCV